MKKLAYLLIASSFLFVSCSNDDVDFEDFCNVILGKACGYDISNTEITECAAIYEAEYNNHSKCSKEASKYFNCVSKTKVTPCKDLDDCECLEDDICTKEAEKIDSCMQKNYPDEVE